jgi:hypothetical protein
VKGDYCKPGQAERTVSLSTFWATIPLQSSEAAEISAELSTPKEGESPQQPDIEEVMRVLPSFWGIPPPEGALVRLICIQGR